MKLLTVALFASLFSLSVFACPDQDQNGRIDDHEVHQYVEELRYLSNGLQRNRIIEKCYLKHNSKLNFSQVNILLNGLYNYTSGSASTNRYDNEETQDRITANYFSSKINTMTPELAVSVAKKQDSGLNRNQKIEEYFNAHKFDLSWSEVQTLLNGLYNYTSGSASTNRYDNEETQDRIIEEWNNCQ